MIKSFIKSKLSVEFPPGSGGRFLSTVLACCTNNLPWYENYVNFHNSLYLIPCGHKLKKSTSCISIDNTNARFNFWIYYFKKKILYETSYYRFNSRRWPLCYENSFNIYENGFFLLNTAIYVQTYQSKQHWNIDWVEMLENPELAWDIICNFLNFNNEKNYWSITEWFTAIQNYKHTLSQVKLNTNHISWKIWAVANLHNKNIHPDWNLIENFNNNKFCDWLGQYKTQIFDDTVKTLYQSDLLVDSRR